MRNYKLYTQKANPAMINRHDALFRAIFDESPDAIFLMDPGSFEILDCNEKSIRLFEADEKSDIEGKDPFALYESEPVEFSKSIFIETINKGDEHIQEMAFKSMKGNIFWGRGSFRRIDTPAGAVVILRVRRVVDYMKTAEMLSSMIKKTAKATGYAYFGVLTELLSKTFGVCMAMVAKADIKTMTATSIHCWHKSKKIENITFNLETSPSLNVMRGYPTFYPSNLQEMFPDDKLIGDLGITGYLGTPIFCSGDDVCGLLILMDDKRMEEIPNSRYILSIFASRAGAEMERIEVEENYRRKIRELEQITAGLTVSDPK